MKSRLRLLYNPNFDSKICILQWYYNVIVRVWVIKLLITSQILNISKVLELYLPSIGKQFLEVHIESINVFFR